MAPEVSHLAFLADQFMVVFGQWLGAFWHKLWQEHMTLYAGGQATPLVLVLLQARWCLHEHKATQAKCPHSDVCLNTKQHKPNVLHCTPRRMVILNCT